MAAGAILEIGDTFFAVLTFDLPRLMRMTAVASVADQAVRVAYPAGTHPALSVVDGEGMLAVESGWRPGSAVVAGRAVTAEQPHVVSWLGVAGGALLRRPLEYPIFVAVGAGN